MLINNHCNLTPHPPPHMSHISKYLITAEEMTLVSCLTEYQSVGVSNCKLNIVTAQLTTTFSNSVLQIADF